MSTVIYHAAKDESKRYKGGKAGDQTGTEVYARSWYPRPWAEVYEPPTPEIGREVARLAKIICDNNNVGYDQNQRNGLLLQAKKHNWDFEEIGLCECDCSSLASVLAIAVGASESSMVTSGNCKTTATIGSALVKNGWKKHTDKKYLTSSDYIGEGWMLNYPRHHIAINGTDGKKFGKGSSSANSGKSGGKCPYTEPKSTVKAGMRGTAVSWLQWHLNTLIDRGILKGVERLVVDGDFGSKTAYVFEVFQKYYPATGTNNKPDGKCGSKARAKLKALVA